MLRKIFVVVNSKRKKSQYVLVQFGNVPVSVDTSLLFSFTALHYILLHALVLRILEYIKAHFPERPLSLKFY